MYSFYELLTESVNNNSQGAIITKLHYVLGIGSRSQLLERSAIIRSTEMWALSGACPCNQGDRIDQFMPLGSLSSPSFWDNFFTEKCYLVILTKYG
jgi:hypothetical protein